MIKFLRNERGFTLMEMLVVLAIFMVVSASIIYVTAEKLAHYTNEQIINQTELLIRLGQAKSIETNSSYEFYVFNCREIQLRHTSKRDEILYQQVLPDGMEIHVSTSNRKIIFQANGNIRTSGTITYHLTDYLHHFSINLGKGRLIFKSVIAKPEGINACGHISSSRDFIFPDVYNHTAHL